MIRKSHILQLLLFLIGLSLLLQGLAWFSTTYSPRLSDIYLDNDKTMAHQMLANSETITALSIGNSHSGALDFDVLGAEGYIVARASADLLETAAIVNYLVPHMPNLDTIYIPVSYFAFEWETLHQDKFLLRRHHVYTAYGVRWPISNDLAPFMLGKLHPVFPITDVLREDNWKQVIYDLQHPGDKSSFDNLERGGICNGVEAAALADNSSERAASHIESTVEMVSKRPELSQAIESAVIDLIETAQAHDIDLIFYTPPYYADYSDVYASLDNETPQQMRAKMQQLAEMYGVTYHDYSTLASIVHNADWFHDADHLNGCGRRAFSEHLRPQFEQDSLTLSR